MSCTSPWYRKRVVRRLSRLKALFLVAVLAAGLLSASPPLPAVAGTGEGLAYIAEHQMPDGGFAEPGRTGGADATTAWCIMAIRAGGGDPNTVRKEGRSPLDFLASQAGSWRSVTDYERTLLAAAAAGRDPRSFGGVDLVARVQSFQNAGGNIGDAVNSNAFGILAYRAAGLEVPPGAVDWQVRSQNSDGGWGNNPGAASNPDMTAASIMALRAAGVGPDDPAIMSALGHLHSRQNDDGGFSFEPGTSDVSSTAWCVQAIVAAGQDPAAGEWSKNGRTPFGFVASMQAADGRFLWTEATDKNPVWTTSYAVCALSRKPYPIGITYPVPASGQGDGGSEADAGGEPAPAGGGTSQENEAADGGEGQGEVSGTQVDDAGQQAGETSGGEEEPAQEAVGAAAKRGREGGRSEESPPGGTSFLVWLIPLAVAAPLISLGGWWLYRRYAASRAV